MRMESGGRVKTILNLGSKKKDGPINRDDEVRERRWLVIKKGKRERKWTGKRSGLRGQEGKGDRKTCGSGSS